MAMTADVTRRRFMGSAAAALAAIGLKPDSKVWAQPGRAPTFPMSRDDEYDSLIKLASNENPWGPSEAMMEAMNSAWKYSNRYGYPDGNVREVIAEHHGVRPENILLHAGSAETLRVAGLTFLGHDEKVVGVEPTFTTVYQAASGIDADVVALPLNDDATQNIDEMIRVTRRNYRDVGMVYLCNPNNPTGITVSSHDVQKLLDGIPEDIPVLIDEAYHHFIMDPSYATAVPYVKEGRKVLVTRTFSKIYGMAGMRLGYGIAPRDMISDMRRYTTGTVNALAKWGGVAALADTETEHWVRDETIRVREETREALIEMGFKVLPSDTNFFMVHTGRMASEVRGEFRRRNIAVGRDFPPMLDYLRVSISTEGDMDKFMEAWQEIFPDGMTADAGTRGN